MTRSELFAAAKKHRVRRRAGRWAVFGCGDPGYVPKLLVALASAKENNPQLDAFLFCTSCGDGDLAAAGRAGVDIVFCDPSLPFVRPSRPGLPFWPRESFAHLLAWRILSSFGYDFSLSIDADVLCCNPLPLESINIGPVDFAAVSNGSAGHQFRSIDLPDREERRYFSALPGLGRRAANTGIMAWNHRRLKAVRFHKKILSVLRGLPQNYAVPSDQHLLAIAMATYPFRIAWLDTRWNFCFGSETGVGRLKLYQSRWHPDRFVASLDTLFFLHLFKPWEMLVNPERGMASSASENCFREGLVQWLKIARSLYGEEWSKPLLGRPFGQADAEPLRPCPSAWPQWMLRLAARVLAPFSGLSLLLERELRPVSEYLGCRPPADFSLSLLQMAIPALHPERLVLRSGSVPDGQLERPRFSIANLLGRVIRRVLRAAAPGLLGRWDAVETRRYFYRRYHALHRRAAPSLFQGRPIAVLSGPFQGMRYLDEIVWGSITPKWLGSYECELHDTIEEIVGEQYSTIIDIGCAEGYYAVGLAFRIPSARIFAYDTDFLSRRQAARLARGNGVQSRVRVKKFCTASEITRLHSGRTLVFCDIEGFERDVLDPVACPALQTTDILVEVHEEKWVPTTEDLLVERFSPTHSIQTIRATDRREWISAEAGTIWPDADAELLAASVNEDRSNGSTWLWMKHRPPAGHRDVPQCPA